MLGDMERVPPHRCRQLWQVALALLLCSMLDLTFNTIRGVHLFVPGAVRTRITPHCNEHSVSLYAKLPKVEEEPDLGKGFATVAGSALVDPAENRISATDRVTLIDKLLGFDKYILARRDEDDPFVDSSNELNYITVTLPKPLGIEFVENSPADGGGVVVGGVVPGGNAEASGLIQAGYHLIMAGGQPVYGLSIEEATQPIIEKDEEVQLTFFVGDAEFFYGEFRPSADWLAEFIEKLQAAPREAQ